MTKAQQPHTLLSQTIKTQNFYYTETSSKFKCYICITTQHSEKKEKKILQSGHPHQPVECVVLGTHSDIPKHLPFVSFLFIIKIIYMLFSVVFFFMFLMFQFFELSWILVAVFFFKWFNPSFVKFFCTRVRETNNFRVCVRVFVVCVCMWLWLCQCKYVYAVIFSETKTHYKKKKKHFKSMRRTIHRQMKCALA